MSLLRGLAELPAEVGIVTVALGYPGKWYGTRRGTGLHAATRTATKIGVSALVIQIGLES